MDEIWFVDRRVLRDSPAEKHLCAELSLALVKPTLVLFGVGSTGEWVFRALGFFCCSSVALVLRLFTCIGSTGVYFSTAVVPVQPAY